MFRNKSLLWQSIDMLDAVAVEDIRNNWAKYHLAYDGCKFVRERSAWSTPWVVDPSAILASSEAWLYENGQSVWPIQLDASTTRGDNDIQSVVFRRWTTPINTIDPANPAGGLESYADVGPFTTSTNRSVYIEDNVWLNSLSNQISISFASLFFRGTNANASIAEPEVEALANNQLQTTYVGTYALASALGEYKYFSRPVSLWQVVDPTLNFIDDNTWFPIPFVLENTISITNSHWYTEMYHIYRSVNVLGGALNIRIT